MYRQFKGGKMFETQCRWQCSAWVHASWLVVHAGTYSAALK